MISIAYAQQAAAPMGGGIIQFLPIVVIFLVFYFLVIRPQSKRVKQHQEVLKNLKRDDWVVTSGGLHGRVHGLTDQVVTIEVDQNVKIKVDRTQVARVEKGV